MAQSSKTFLIYLLFIIINCFAFSSTSFAQWWNPLEPKDYDDCVLKNLKSGMGDEAVKALQNSCMQKYPPKASAAELLMYKNRANRYSKCNVEQDHYKKHKFINLGWRNSYKTNEVISKLKNLKYDRSLGNVSFQNMNSFGISGVAVGFTVNKQCPQKTEDYQFSTYCTNNSSESGVAASAYGSLVCGQLPNEAKAMGFCAIGYSPIYDPYNESILDFLEKNSYCN